MAQFMKALKEKSTGKIIYFFPNNKGIFTSPDHELVDVEVKEVISGLCKSCTIYDDCKSGLKGHDHDCSSYTTDPPDLQTAYESVDYTIRKYEGLKDGEYEVSFLYPANNKAFQGLLKARDILKKFKK